MTRSEQIEYLKLLSVRVRKFKSEQFPVGFASGCLLDYGGRRWLLTVAHAIGDGGKWCIEIGYDEDRRSTKLYCIGAPTLIANIDLAAKSFDEIDFAYACLPDGFGANYDTLEDSGKLIKSEKHIVLAPSSLAVTMPHPEMHFGFCGTVQPTDETHFGQRYLGTVTRCFPEMEFVGTVGEHYYDFRLPHPRPDDSFLKGTSGAPIADNEGRLVALVCGPGGEIDMIRGVRISLAKTALDAEISGKH